MKKRFLLFGSFLLLIGFLLGYMFSKVSRNNYAYLDEEEYLHLNKKCKLLTSHKKRNGIGIQFIPFEDVRYGMYPLCPSCITERDYELLKEKSVKTIKQKVSDKGNKKSSGSRIYKTKSGKAYDIPENMVAEFENDIPDATVEMYNDDADFYETYSKSLSALKNFLKTNEKMEWYAEACLKNCEEALNRAEKSEKSLEEETKNNIAHHINKIRVCGKKEFEKYWDKILELEKRREKTPPIQLL